jgi:hypothetical protein
MQGMPLAPGQAPMPEYVMREVIGPTHSRRIALLGLNTEDPSCYTPGVFGGCTIEPLNDACERLFKKVQPIRFASLLVMLTLITR